ncbi:MAG: NAD-dependent succinate-semialdehyde dehydrogenase [Acidimicrobiales bacterium]
MTLTTINPSTGETLESYAETSEEQVDVILDDAHLAASKWRTTPVAARADAVRGIADALRKNRQSLAELGTLEMGKPIGESLAEVDKCAGACDWFAENGPAFMAAEPVKTESVLTEVTYVPLGVLFAIMPWNYPYWQVIRAIAPALTAGNVVVLKHAPSTTGCALALGDLVESAGLPKGSFSVIVAGFEQTPVISERIIADDRVSAVTLTGSTGAGRAVAALAGRALKKTVLELGGSDPFIVLADADVEAAANNAVRSRFQNTGQSCIATKRVIVANSIADQFNELLLAGVRQLKVGDPMQPDTKIGPLARSDLRDIVERQVNESVKLGARVLIGGKPADRPGFFFEPTVLDHTTPEMPVWNEEVFGPAVPVARVEDADEAVELANETRFGLGSNLWTSDLEKGRLIASRLDAGFTAINGFTASDPRLPFGGVKDSGYGRELSHYGMHEFVNIHSVVTNGPKGQAGQDQPTTE